MPDVPDGLGETAGVYSQPHWAVYEGKEKIIRVYAANKDFEEGHHEAYTVPAGKALYIVSGSWIMHAYNRQDADHPLYSEFHIINQTTGDTLSKLAGMPGGWVEYPEPFKISAGVEIRVYVINYSAVRCYIDGSARCYEV